MCILHYSPTGDPLREGWGGFKAICPVVAPLGGTLLLPRKHMAPVKCGVVSAAALGWRPKPPAFVPADLCVPLGVLQL